MNEIDDLYFDFVAEDYTKYKTVSIVETLTAGSFGNILTIDPNMKNHFLGGIVSYSTKTQHDILKINKSYADQITALQMAKNVAKIFDSELGISNIGYTIPNIIPNYLTEPCATIKPFAYICLYDVKQDFHKIYHFINDDYDSTKAPRILHGNMKIQVALRCKAIYEEYIS
jgi:hypothetical protein